MATIGSLALALRANAKGFTKTLQGARGALKRFTGSIGPFMNQMAKMGGIAGGVGVGGLSLLVKNQLEAIDAAGKHAQAIGISMEALTGLRHAANQAGVESNVLDMALQRMSRRVGQAAQGTGEAVKVLDQLGLSASELNKLAPDEQLNRIADAMMATEDQGTLLAQAMGLFDTEGVKMVNALKNGSAGLMEMREEAKALGATLSDADAFKAAEAIDAMDEMGKAIGGVLNALAVELAPFIKAGADAITAWSTDGVGAGEKMQEVIGGLIKGSAILADIWYGMKGAVNAVGGAILGIVSVAFTPLSLLVKGVDELGQLLGLVDENGSDFANTVQSIQDVLNDSSGEMFDNAGEAFGKVGEASEEAERFLRQIKRAADERAADAANGEKQVSQMGELATLAERYAEGMEAASSAMGGDSIQAAAPEQADKIVEDVKAIRDAVEKAPPLWDKVATEIGKTRVSVVDVVKRMNRSSTQAILSLRQLVQQLAVEQQAQRERLDAIQSGLAGS